MNGRLSVAVTIASITVLSAPIRAQNLSDSVEDTTVTISIDAANANPNDQLYLINLVDCLALQDSNPTIVMTWDFENNAPTDAHYSIKVQEGDQTCNHQSFSEEESDLCVTYRSSEDLDGATLTERLTFREITGIVNPSDCDERSTSFDVSLIFTSFNTATEELAVDEIRFEVVTTRPAAPTGLSLVAGESSLAVDWLSVSEAVRYEVFYSTTRFSEGDAPEDLARDSSITSTVGITLSDDINRNATYYVGATSQDSSGNASLLSEIVTVSTQPVRDFWELYREEGGAEVGGCGVAGGRFAGGLAGLGFLFLGLVLIRRRPFASKAAMVLMISFLGAISARADGIESDINGEFEIKFGEYLPAIDSEFSGTGPYETVFGPGGSLYAELEYDHYLSREYGGLAVGLGIGYMSAGGNGILADGTNSVDSTDIWVVPLRLSLVYRLDLPARDLNIPIVPYFKVGADYYLWWIESAAGIASYRNPETGDLDEGRGSTLGWHTAFGVQFLLDVLSPMMSRTFDASSGVNNSYLFIEMLTAEVDDFGDDTSLRLGDTTALFGIAFEL
jgi:hypothetical protein